MARQGTAKQALEAKKQEQINAAVPATPATPATPPATPTPTPAAPNPQDTLTGSGVASDRVKAVVSARTPAPQAPQSVVPPAPTPTPTPTPQAIQQPAWNYGTAENPVYAQTPETPQAPEAKPTSTQPVTTEVGREQAFGQLAKQPEAQTRQAELKSVRENLKDDSGKQLWDNMASISASNPNLLQDRNAYNQAFGYDGKDAGEKAMVDSYWRSTRPKSEDIYRSLEAGQGVPQRSLGTSEAVEAIERKSELTKYENLNPYQLSKLIGSELIPGSQVYNDLSTKNPSLITNATKLAQINLPVTNQIAPKTNWQEAISQMMQKSPTMQDPMTVEKIMNSDPAISQKTNEVNQYDNQINELTQQQKNLLANVTERYKGTGASKATINARYLSESRDLTDQLALLTAQKNSASLALTTLIQNGKDNYEMSRQSRLDAEASYYKNMDAMMQMANMGMQQENLEYQRAQEAIDRDLQQMQYWQQREDGFIKDDLSFERDLYKTKVTQEYQMQMDDRNFNQQKELAQMGYQNQRDMANLGFEQGMYEQGTRAQSDLIKELVSKGTSYQDAVNQVMGGTTGGGLGDIRHMAGQFPGEAWAKNNNPSGITWNAASQGLKDAWTAAGIQFGQGTSRPSNEGGNYVSFPTIEDGIEAQWIALSRNGGDINKRLQAWVGTSEGPRYAPTVMGWAGIPNGTTFEQLNAQQKESLKMALIKKESPGLYKLLQSQPAKPTNVQQQSGTTGFSQQSIPQFQNYLTTGKIGTSAEEVKAINAEFGSVAEFKRQAELYNNSENGPRQKELEKLNKLKAQLEGLIGPDNQGAIDNSIGAWQWTANAKIPTSTRNKKEVYLSDVQNFLEGKTLQTLIDAKAEGATFGALSNEELKMLQNSASKLNQLAIRGDKEDKNRITGFRGTKEEYEKAINSMLETYSDLIAKKQGQISNTNQSAQGSTTQGASTAGGSTAPSNIPTSVIQDSINRSKARQ